MRKILLTGGRAPVCLELARGFGADGYQIFLAESTTYPLAGFSKYVTAVYSVHQPRQHQLLFIRDLIRIIRIKNIDCLFPTCEEVFYISKYKDLIKRYCPEVMIVADGIKTMDILHNKYEFYKLCRQLRLTVPATRLFEQNMSTKDLSRPDRKIVAKPVYSRFGSFTRVADCQSILPEIAKETPTPWIIQAYIPGDVVCSYSYCERGRVRFHALYKENYKTSVKAAVNFCRIRNEKITGIIEQIVAYLHYSGNISFDFICNHKDIYLIECNPRITSGIHLLRGNHFRDLFFSNDISSLSYQNAKITLAMLRYGIPGLNHKNLICFLRTMAAYPDIIYDRKDKSPVYGQFLSWSEMIIKAISNRISVTEASTYDIEWNGSTEA